MATPLNLSPGHRQPRAIVLHVPSPEASRRNLELARLHHRSPQPWRSEQESSVIRGLVWQWFTCRNAGKWSARALARRLGVSHTYVQKLVREFGKKLAKMLREEREQGFNVATFEHLLEAQECTRKMRMSGLLRPLIRCTWVKIRDPLGRWPKRGIGWKAVPPKAKTRVLRTPEEVPIWATSAYNLIRANSGMR